MDKITELFCLIDDFCQQFEPLLEQRMLDSSGKQRRNRTGSMSLSEMTTIVVLFHTMRGRQFKEFYRGNVCRFMTSEFPRQLSYTRFVALMPRCATVLAAFYSQRSRVLAQACQLPIQRRWPFATTCASSATKFSRRSRSAANRPLDGFTASSCTRSSIIGANCSPSRSRQATSMTARDCWPSHQTCLASCTPTRATLAKSLCRR